MTRLSGGCLCQALRYTLSQPPLDVVNCHCSTCRRACGAPYVAWVVVRRDALVWPLGEPRFYRSSPDAERGFCPTCGTPLVYRNRTWPEECDLTLGSLDQPERLKPTRHIWVKHALPWLRLDDGLPRHLGESPPAAGEERN